MIKHKKSKCKKIVETVLIECTSANVIAVVGHAPSPDSPRDITALDCKSDARNFERLLRYFIAAFAKHYGVTQRRLCQVAPRQEMRAALREALKRFNPEKKYRFTTYAIWWVRQAILPYQALLPRRPRLVQKLYTTGQGR